MAASTRTMLEGSTGALSVRIWPNPDARYVALISHGYGEHIGRYEHVAERLVDDGAAVYGPDHLGHGESEGERALITEGERLTSDLRLVEELARAEHPGLPVVLIGHSMGGLIATRYAQQYGDGLAALVASAPAIGDYPAFRMLLEIDPIPEVPIDPTVLSRDPEVGAAYAADPLVYHGPFKRETVASMFEAVERVAAGPALGRLPTLYLHGEDDMLVPFDPTREAVERIRGEQFESRAYPGARHEILNETNKDEVLDDVIAFLHRHL